MNSVCYFFDASHLSHPISSRACPNISGPAKLSPSEEETENPRSLPSYTEAVSYLTPHDHHPRKRPDTAFPSKQTENPLTNSIRPQSPDQQITKREVQRTQHQIHPQRRPSIFPRQFPHSSSQTLWICLRSCSRRGAFRRVQIRRWVWRRRLAISPRTGVMQEA